MSVYSLKLKNGAYVSAVALEITEIPKEKPRASDMIELLSVLSDTARNQNFSIEMIYKSVEDNSQVTRARVRLFLILRKYGIDPQLNESELEKLMSLSDSALKSCLYCCVSIDVEMLFQILSCSSKEHVLTLERSPIVDHVSDKLGWGWYFKHVDEKCSIDLSCIVDLLLQNPEVSLSLSIVPSEYTVVEKTIIQDAYLNLLTAKDGSPSSKVSEYYDREKSNLSKRMELMAISLIGENQIIDRLGVQLSSLLSSCGIDYECVAHGELRGNHAFYPWNLLSMMMKNYQARRDISPSFSRFPYLYSQEETAAFFQLPYDDGFIRGMRINSNGLFRSFIDDRLIQDNNVKIGTLNETIPIGIPLNDFSRHALIVGMPGTGKTTFAINLLLQFYQKGIPFLVIEPTKSEYRALIESVADLNIFTPGKNDLVPFILNPFLPPDGVPLEVFKPSLFSAFKAAFSMPNPLDILFYRALDECYLIHGWRSYSVKGDAETEIFGLHEFIKVFRDILDNSSYSSESKDNMKSAGVFRLMDLISQGGNIYDTVNSVPIADILEHPTIIELNAIENQSQKALLMSLLLIQVVLYTKQMKAGDGNLKNIMMIDEAHVLLNPDYRNSVDSADAGSSAVKALQNMILEIRSYGTGIVISDQSPNKVTAEIVGNTDLKVCFQLVQSDDRDMIAKATSMNEQFAEEIPRLQTGEAFVFFRGLSGPLKIVTEDIRAKLGINLVVSDHEVKEKVRYWDERQEILKPYPECSFLPVCKTCDFVVREDAKYYSALYYEQKARMIGTDEDVFVAFCSIGAWLQENVIGYPEEKYHSLLNCTRVMFVRKLSLERNVGRKKDSVKKYFKLADEQVDNKFGYTHHKQLENIL